MDEIHDYELLDPKKQKIKSITKEVLCNLLATIFYTITSYYFILGNDFAPSGFSGILAIIEKVKDIQNASLVLLAMNVPLLIWSYFRLPKRFSIYTAMNVLVMCGGFYLLGVIDKNEVFKFKTMLTDVDGNQIFNQIAGANVEISAFGKKLFCSIISGVCSGIAIAVTFRNMGSLGGVDIIVMIIQHKKPYANVSILLIAVNIIVIIAGCFVFSFESICFAVIYILIFSKVSDYILSGTKRALKFEVVTTKPDELSAELIQTLGHSVTVTRATGMFEHKENYLLICVIRPKQIADFEKILRKYPDSFAFASPVSEVFGVFFK